MYLNRHRCLNFIVAAGLPQALEALRTEGTRSILIEGGARISGSVLTDKLARCKDIYDREGGDRMNLAHGYINRG